jgi:hypothetical protein
VYDWEVMHFFLLSNFAICCVVAACAACSRPLAAATAQSDASFWGISTEQCVYYGKGTPKDDD